MILSYAVFRARLDRVHHFTVDRIDRIDRYDRSGLLRVRVDCVDHLTVNRINRIDRYDRKGLFRVDCVNQLTIDCINHIDRYDRRGLLRVRIDCVSQLTEGAIVLINWLSIVSIVPIRSKEALESKSWLCQSTDWRGDCVDQLTVDCIDRTDKIEGGSWE